MLRRGTAKLAEVDESDEPVHVLIRGPTDEAVAKAKEMVETLIDFNSAEGEVHKVAVPCSTSMTLLWESDMHGATRVRGA